MNLFEAIFGDRRLDRTAVLYEQRRISYAELRRLALRIARALDGLGIKRGDRVALLLNDSPEFVSSFIAICSSGAIAVPINMGLLLDEQQLILNDCGARAAIVEPEIARELKQLDQLKHVVVVERKQALTSEVKTTQRKRGEKLSEIPNVRSLEELLEAGEESITRFPETAENEPSFILYTSGSTGEPKGAVHRQADIYYTNETYCREVLRLRAGDRLFSSSRLPFAYGLGNSFTFPLMNGCTTILCREKPTPEVISRLFTEYKPTIFFGVPVIYNLLLERHRKGQKLDCSSLRLCVSAGEALPAQLGEDWQKTFGVPVLDGIGSTEMLHMWMSNHEGDVRYGSSGKVLQGYEARLLDPDGNQSPPGAEGNLWVKGSSAALGYWQKPEVTARTFVDGWVRTGDLYRQDSEGYWHHMGRSDDCFKSSGQWVSPVEVENVLLKHRVVSRAAVVEDFDETHLPCACAFVVTSEPPGDVSLIEQELRAWVRDSLPRFKQPRRYVFVDELPYTATGKIQRFKLRELLRKNREVSSSEFRVSSSH